MRCGWRSVAAVADGRLKRSTIARCLILVRHPPLRELVIETRWHFGASGISHGIPFVGLSP